MRLHLPALFELFVLSLCCAPAAAAQIALYDAGVAGDPPVAPSPTTVGWIDAVWGGATVQDVSPDPAWGINAWQITDQGPGSALYRMPFAPSGVYSHGFDIILDMRILASTIVLEIDTGELITNSFYEIEFTTQGTDVIVDSHPFGGSDPIVCPGGADGGYHTFRFTGWNFYLRLEYDGVDLGLVEETQWGLYECCDDVRIGTPVVGAGRARFHRIVVAALGYGFIGENYCGPAVANSSGAPATIEAFGWNEVGQNDFTLNATDLPQDQFGYFLASQSEAFVAMPGGSQGNLCLGGTIGRFTAQVASSGAEGELSIAVDLDQLPSPLTGVTAGETWNWQCWFRDVNPGSTSNFTDGTRVLFE